MCRGDLNEEQCHDCVETASNTIVESCPFQKEAIVWYEECMVRYANHPIFSFKDEGQFSYAWSVLNVSDPVQFGDVISETMDGLITQTAYNKTRRGYATSSDQAENVYAFAQCTPDILGCRCERCLRVAFRNMGGCCGTARRLMEMYLPSCWLRYGQEPFIGEFSSNDTDITELAPKSSSKSEPIPVFDFLPPNNTSVVPPQARSGGSQLTSMTNYLIATMVLTVSFLCMAW
ncbi:cysteine-rich repeat secretory protein 4-like [Spinacia oleracea]|uniref:Cysteine-rich repeat secretory protein 4-like n=1 Tax=Spinacia oleracea TaxID=3562 RepID=A0A9R0HUS8_SPIOL|nr:cysteine-rich repeat secretory protein 4-like [Spinacia oleracea]